MAEDPDSLALQYVRRLDAKLDRIIDDVHGIKVSVTTIEEGLAGVNRRLDRFEACLERVERRLGLVGSFH